MVVVGGGLVALGLTGYGVYGGRSPKTEKRKTPIHHSIHYSVSVNSFLENPEFYNGRTIKLDGFIPTDCSTNDLRSKSLIHDPFANGNPIYQLILFSESEKGKIRADIDLFGIDLFRDRTEIFDEINALINQEYKGQKPITLTARVNYASPHRDYASQLVADSISLSLPNQREVERIKERFGRYSDVEIRDNEAIFYLSDKKDGRDWKWKTKDLWEDKEKILEKARP